MAFKLDFMAAQGNSGVMISSMQRFFPLVTGGKPARVITYLSSFSCLSSCLHRKLSGQVQIWF